MNRCALVLALLVSASAAAQVTEPPLLEVPPVERYSPMNAAQRPLTVPDRLLTIGLLMGPRYAFVEAPASRFESLGNGDMYLRYGITDRLEWGVPFFLTYRLGDLEAREGFETAIFGGVSGFGFGFFGTFVQPAVGAKLRRLVSENVAFVGSVMGIVAVGSVPVSVQGESQLGFVINLSDRWSLDLSVTPRASWFEDRTGARRLGMNLGVGGPRRPLVRFHFRPRIEFLGSAGVELFGGAPSINAGLGAEVRL